MKKMMNKIFAVFMCFVLALSIMLPVTAVASSITVILENDGKAVTDVAFKIYYVAEITDSSDYSLIGDFKNSGVDFNAYNQDNNSDYADKLKAYAEKNNIKSVSEKVTDANGKAVFENLNNGVYLIVGKDFKNGKVTPFVAQLPSLDENGKLTYNITAKPKSEIINPEDKTEKTTEIITTKYDEDNNNGEKLPQTGQLWWPVCPLIAVGLLFIIFGVAYRRREENEEKK